MEGMLQNWSETQNCDFADERPTSSNKIGDKSNLKNDKKQNENTMNLKVKYPTNGLGQIELCNKLSIKAFFIWAKECSESIKGRYKFSFKEHSELRRKVDLKLILFI